VLILFDNNIPRGLIRALPDHTVTEARERGWDALQNSDLLRAAEDAGFQVIVTSDKRIKYQQNLDGRTIALVVLTQGRWGPIRKEINGNRHCLECRHARQLYGG